MAKIDAEAARIEAAQARIAAEISGREIEQYLLAEQAKVDGILARIEAHTIGEGVENGRWENALYGAIGGLFIALTSSAVGFSVNRRKDRVWNRQVCEHAATPVDASPRSQNTEVEIGSHTLSPEVAISEAAFGGGLEKQVAAINAARYGPPGQWRLLSRSPHSQLIWKSR